MTAPAPREDRVKCCHCGTILGTMNSGDRHAKAHRQPSRVVTAQPHVHAFIDLAMSRVELLCPSCGAIGRILRADRIRGVVLELQNELTHHDKIRSN